MIMGKNKNSRNNESYDSKNVEQEKWEREQIEEDGRVNSYVPFRNGLMLSSVATLAHSLYPEDEVHIFLGAHADDSA